MQQLHEMLNAELKSNLTKQAPTRIKRHRKKAVISHLLRLQKSPKRVAFYFMHKPIRYAAEFKISYFLSRDDAFIQNLCLEKPAQPHGVLHFTLEIALS
ncbi:MAG: hypothetical protein VB140_01960 [Burkholderia sp.]|nr:MAG: hypothetical protein E5299_01312 [Burkholderia gladioli]